MEVRGERRGFMETMRAFFTTIRKRIGQRRTRQRTNNYRICRNLAMAKIESKKERRLKKAKVTRGNKSANVKAEVNSAKRHEDGAPSGLRARMMSALQAFREGRKPQWVRQRCRRINTDNLNMEYIQAGENLCESQAREDIQTQARENLHETQISLEIQARVDIHTLPAEDTQETQASPDTHTGENIQAEKGIQTLARESVQNQTGENLQTPVEYIQKENLQTQPSTEIQATEVIQTQAGQDHQTESRENLHDTRTGEDIQKAGKDLQTQAKNYIQKGPDTQTREDIKTEVRENLQTQASPEIQMIENIQTQAQKDLLPDEPASWVVAYGQMWHRMTQNDSHDLYKEDLHATQATEEPASWVVANSQMWQKITHRHDQDLYVEGAYNTKGRASLDDSVEADEPASWFVANGQIWGNTHKDDSSVTSSMLIMDYSPKIWKAFANPTVSILHHC